MLRSTIKSLLRPTTQALPRRLFEITPIVPPPPVSSGGTHCLDHPKPDDTDFITPSLNKANSFSTHQPVYASFDFGFFLDPKFVQTSLHFRPETDEIVGEETSSDEERVVIRADSVKKKRKKKMNKHKLRKLRKRLSRKT